MIQHMERTLYKELLVWKNSPARLPLIIRGARQVGKSYLVEQFGEREFDTLCTINFEKKPQWISCFDSLDPKDILKQLELRAGLTLSPGNTLLFLDEIQDCPQALKALRYFAEEMPQLHVIAAGSLLEFVLEDAHFSFPVGRVQIMNLGPLTFTEYLNARDQSALASFLETVNDGNEISEGLHLQLLEFIHEYFRIGGMPGVVSIFKSTESYQEAQRRQGALIDLYTLDFGKYATKYAEHRHLKKLFERAPHLVGKHFKFSKIDPDCANPARDYRAALQRLSQARLIIPIHFTKGNGLPLRAEKSDKRFKIFLLDVGFLIFGLGWEYAEKQSSPETSIFHGVAAEQFVAQELIALQDPFIDRGLYYWENTERSSSAEIDFLVNLNQRMTPIEVKSGTTGRLKSLRQFMQVKKCVTGVRISERKLTSENGILSVPFYLVGQLPRLLSNCH